MPITTKKYSPAEPISDLQYIPIQDCGEPLMDYRETCPGLLIDTSRFVYKREFYVRKSLTEFLNHAVSRTPKGLKLAILEGWRPFHIQRRMYIAVRNNLLEKHPDWSETKLLRKTNQFTAPINNKRVPPPHTTGGAIDIFVAHPDGKLLNHVAPFDRFDIRCFPMDAEGLNPEAREARDILKHCFADSGLTNYPSEYWHWSYGDQGWAYRGGHAAALYNMIEPTGYKPDDEEAIDEALPWTD